MPHWRHPSTAPHPERPPMPRHIPTLAAALLLAAGGAHAAASYTIVDIGAFSLNPNGTTRVPACQSERLAPVA